jgi:hypothetical protein
MRDEHNGPHGRAKRPYRHDLLPVRVTEQCGRLGGSVTCHEPSADDPILDELAAAG